MATQWPPRSPHEALLSTPGGRERMRRLAAAERQTSPSPSPSKLRTSRSVSALKSSRTESNMPDPFEEDMDMDMDDDDEGDEDDEEMLQLKLQAIQARMKLKKLQAAKAAQKKATAAGAASTSDSLATNGRQRRADSIPSSSRTTGQLQSQGLPVQSKLAAARDRMDRVPAQNNNAGGGGLEVPASPIRKAAPPAPELQTSPQRILLGIDKGRKATEMSLKRAPSMRRLPDEGPPPPQGGGGGGGYLRRSNTVTGQLGAATTTRPLSFNERLASVRAEETSRQEKQKRIQQVRTKAFSIGRQEMEDYKTKAVDLPEIPYKAPEYSREDIISGRIPRSSTTPALGGASGSGGSFSDDPFGSSTATGGGGGDSEASFESYSGLHLSKRILPHKVLTRAITGKKTYVLKDLLRHVKAPDWSLPEVESDIVVFAIVANKSDPKSHRPIPGKEQSDRGKYMVINLVDLTYEVDLFLFNSGFDRFWKLTPGTVLAILNPNIMPPPQGREDTGRFGLVINSDEDTILEIGSARDLGYCKSVKKDGTLCSTWVNARRSEYCEFHTNEAIRKAREGRIELNQMSFGGGERYKKNSKEVWLRKQQEEKKKQMGGYDRFTQSHYFVSSAHSTADLMDDEKANGIVDRVEREEALKRRLAAKEKERDIAKKLGEIGGGAGKEYMISRAASAASGASSSASAGGFLNSRRRQERTGTGTGLGSSISSGAGGGGGGSGSCGGVSTSVSSFSSTGASEQQPGLPGQMGHRWDARALGLVGKRGDGSKVELGPPLKRKRPESSASNSTSGGGGGIGTGSTNDGSSSLGGGGGGGGKSGTAYGWGSELRSKLGRMKEGERLDGRTVGTTGGGGGNKLNMASVSFPPPTATTSRIPTTTTTAGGTSSPVRKKTRFVTEKGIREAGRDSLGEPLSAAAKLGRQVVLDDDDDDDLIVVK